MWLLSTSNAELRRFNPDDSTNMPQYAILSHVWGKDEQTFQDVQAINAHISLEKPTDALETPARKDVAVSTSSEDVTSEHKSEPGSPLQPVIPSDTLPATSTATSPFDNLTPKIREFCRLAAEFGYEWAWVDTCCIDKTSSAELSEAINSMYAWYRDADLCIAYLEDVRDLDAPLRTEDE